ncbi:DedA family protein [Paenibacillus sp. IHBB 10380]|uniref:DedA family protein n=1 Tax=Paenibacillus sp. IHBB 10380 TaxID=1566358 RepID=UPI0005CF9AEF|nr:DedA family protein [Paenibacillus sp. IHBB 10380]AJS58839.1 membrane protein [Paenibacillus sp. IHBB 10380]
MEWAMEFITQYGYLAIYILLAIGIVGLPVPDEVVMTVVGFLISTMALNFLMSVLVSFAGAITGMTISYMIGKKVGKPLFNKYGRWVGMTPKRFNKVEDWFVRFGPWAIVLGYFIPGIRQVTFYISGISVMPFKKYLFVAGLSGLSWVLIFISIGYYIGVIM